MSQNQEDPNSAGTNRAIVSTFLEDFSNGDFDAAFAVMTDDSCWVIPGRSPLARSMSRQEYRSQVGGLLALMPDGFCIRPTAWTIDGDRVAVEARSEGLVVNGKSYANQYHLLFELEGGKIKQVTEYACSFHVLEVFGEYLRDS